jgi:hypothetical protein
MSALIGERAGMTLRTNSIEAQTGAGGGARVGAMRAALMPMMKPITTPIPGPGRTRAT